MNTKKKAAKRDLTKKKTVVTKKQLQESVHILENRLKDEYTLRQQAEEMIISQQRDMNKLNDMRDMTRRQQELHIQMVKNSGESLANQRKGVAWTMIMALAVVVIAIILMVKL